MKTPEELRESGLERTAFLIDRVTWRGGMACADHQAWYEKKRESWATLGLGVVQELLARISELEAENAQLRLHWQREARNASRTDAALEQAEAHAADCKRLVTACENDLDAERMKRREVEAELKSAKHLNAKWMDERTTALMDKEKAEAVLAERDGMLMTLFMEERDEQVDRGQDFFMPSDIWLADLKARACAQAAP